MVMTSGYGATDILKVGRAESFRDESLLNVPDTSPIATNAEQLGSDKDAQSSSSSTSPDSGESSSEMFEKVAEVVKVIRPAVQADNGDIFLRGVDDESGVVSVELVGACITCPASSQTLKEGLERILKQRVDGVTAVQHVGEELLGFEEGTSVSL